MDEPGERNEMGTNDVSALPGTQTALFKDRNQREESTADRIMERGNDDMAGWFGPALLDANLVEEKERGREVKKEKMGRKNCKRGCG